MTDGGNIGGDGARSDLDPVAGSTPASQDPDIVNLGELAVLVGCSENKIRRLIRDHPAAHPTPFPVLARGANGVPYEFSAVAVAAWWKAHDGEVAAAEDERAGQLVQMRLELFGGEITGNTGRGLTGRMRKDEIDAELAAMRLSRERGELVKAAEVDRCLAVAFTSFRAEAQDLSSVLGRALVLDRDGRNRVDLAVKDMLTRLGDRLATVESYRSADAG
jgi:hypothetical protein